jgi:hypothetical protein
MKRALSPMIALVFLSGCYSAHSAIPGTAAVLAQRKPSSQEHHLFSRALLVEGMDFNSAISVGIYDGMVDAGKKPDVVVSTCGASIANGILNTFPERDARLKFLLSQQYYSILKGATQRDPNLITAFSGFAEKLAGMNLRRLAMSEGFDTIPQIFEGYLLNVGLMDSGSFYEKHFTADDEIRSVIIGAKLHFGPEDVGEKRDGRALYEETYFTDQEIAAKLDGFTSPVAELFPDAAIDRTTATITDRPISDAVRASISDPYLMEPAKLGKDYFVAGTIDLHPLEVANRLADEVAAVYPSKYDLIEGSAVGSSFGDNGNVRLRKYTSSYARYWIDYSDFSPIKDALFGPIQIELRKNLLTTNFPDDLDEFRRKIKSQWYFGYQRGIEAAHQAANSKAHIRGMNDGNSSQATLEEAREEARNQINHQDFRSPLPAWAAGIFTPVDSDKNQRPQNSKLLTSGAGGKSHHDSAQEL